LQKNCQNISYTVRWDEGGTEATAQYTFFYETRNRKHELGTGIGFCLREMYQQLRGMALFVIG
jgi:hypothetical protein